MTTCTTMREYGVAKTQQSLDVLIPALCQAAERLDEENVHKLRVSIRRFQQNVRLFKQYLRPKGVKRVRAELKAVMDLAGELRNRDIAIRLVKKARGATASLETQHAECRDRLEQTLKGMATPYLAEFWRQELGLEVV